MRLKQKLRSIYAPVESSAATAQPVDCAADHYVILMVCFVYTKNDEHTRESARYADHRYIVVIGLLLMAMTGRGSSRNPLEILCSRILCMCMGRRSCSSSNAASIATALSFHRVRAISVTSCAQQRPHKRDGAKNKL